MSKLRSKKPSPNDPTKLPFFKSNRLLNIVKLHRVLGVGGSIWLANEQHKKDSASFLIEACYHGVEQKSIYLNWTQIDLIHQSESSEAEMKILGHFGAILRRSKLFLGHLEVRSITSIKLMALKKKTNFNLKGVPLTKEKTTQPWHL